MAEVNHAKEGGHWYRKDGTPAYTIIGKNGQERNVTLRDARTLDLAPSVTTILAMGYRPGLENWKIDQGILSALTATRIDGESESDFISRIKKDAKEQAAKAAERGTYIHALVQSGFEGMVFTNDDEYEFYRSAKDTLIIATDNEQWICEKSFATERFGGKADLHTSKFLVDIKTHDKPDDKLKLWDEHYMQLAAYREGLGIVKAKCGILYINSVTAESKLIWAEEKELVKGWKCFKALLDFYYAKTGLGGE